jgi:hypothetical protein
MNTPVGFVGRQSELRILGERLAAAGTGHPQVVYVEGEAGGGKSTLLSRFLGSLTDAVVVEVGGDEAETLLSYRMIDQLQPGTLTEPGTDPMAAGTPPARPRRQCPRRARGQCVPAAALHEQELAKTKDSGS